MGIICAFIALFSWGIGDFLIQRSARHFGQFVALFFITFSAAVLLFPFVYRDLASLESTSLTFLFFTSITIFIAALLQFYALKVGKISVIEPILALEVPVIALLSVLILHEYLDLVQSLLVISLMLGIFLVSTQSWEKIKKIRWEKGVHYAIAGSLLMGISIFLFGVGSRFTNPLLVNWFTSTFMSILCFLYLVSQKQHREIRSSWQSSRKLLVGVCFFDNMAWIAFSYSTVYLPVAIATSISESFIVVAALLGVIVNKEHLHKHQWVGFVLAASAAIILSYLVEK